MEIQYTGKVTKNDFLQAIFLNSPQLKLQRWIIGILLVIMAFSLVYLLAVDPNSSISSLFPSQLPILLFVLVIISFPWWVPYLQLSSITRKGSIYRNTVFGNIDDSGITINSDDIKMSFTWNVFVKWKISKDIFMLYQSKNCFNLFTLSMFTNRDEWERFIAFAKEKIASNKKSA